MLSPAQSSALDQTIEALRAELGAARSTVAWSSDYFSGNAKTTALDALDACAARIASLDTAVRVRLNLGDPAYPWSRFVADAEETHSTMAAISGDASTWSLSGILSGAAAATVSDVKEGITTAAPYALGLVVLALAVLVVLELAPVLARVRS